MRSRVLREAVRQLTKEQRYALYDHMEPQWGRTESFLRRASSRAFDSMESVPDLVRLLRMAADKKMKIALRGHSSTVSKTPANVEDISFVWKRDVEHAVHGTDSFFMRPFNLDVWNRQPFTRFYKGFSRKQGLSGWPRWQTETNGNTLMDVFSLKPKGLPPNTLCFFHGTVARFKDHLLRQIQWSLGHGTLGPGFYLTHNPNVAKAYACRTANIKGLRKNEKLIVLEVHVQNAHEISRVFFDDHDFLKPAASKPTFVYNTFSGFDGQMCLRGTAIKHCTIKIVHILDSKSLVTTDTTDKFKTPCLVMP